jgi:protocatechuate 3,4-dioxygenase beta subunit
MSAKSRWFLLASSCVAAAIVLWIVLESGIQCGTSESSSTGTGELVALREVTAETTHEPGATAKTAPEGNAEDGTGRDQPARTAQRRAALAGRIVDANGAPVAGASVSWTPLFTANFGPERTWDLIDWELVESSTGWTESDAEGRFAFDAAPSANGADGSVVWCTRPGFEAARLLLGADEREWPSAPTVRLRPDAPLKIRVVDASAQAVEGAHVGHLGLLPRPDLVLDPREVRAWRVFHRNWVTDEDGAIEAAVLPGKQVVTGKRDALIARPWFGTDPTERSVELVLAPTFTAQGRVSTEDASVDLDRAFVYVSTNDADSIAWALSQVPVEADGEYGPVSLPVVPVARYVFELLGPRLATTSRIVERPDAGQTVRVDFEAARGITLHVRVVSIEGEPIARARATVSWYGEGDRGEQNEAYTDAEGRAEVAGCALGTVWVQAYADGWQHGVVGPLAVADAPAEPVELRLKRAGTLEGRCTHGGEPVRDFEVTYWLDEVSASTTATFNDRADGTFSIEDAPLGRISVFASSPEYAQSATQYVDVASGATARVEIELPAPIAARGRVVDARDGAPIADANVQSWTHDKGWLIRPRGLPVRTAPDGTFELAGIAPGDTWIRVSAVGHALCSVRAFGRPDEVCELGTIALQRTQRLTVRLVSKLGAAFEDFRLRLDGVDPVPLTSFTSDGVAWVDGVGPGAWRYQLRFPDDSLSMGWLDLPAGRDWELSLPVDGNRSLAVEVVPAPGDDLASGLTVQSNLTTPAGIDVAHYQPLDAGGRVVLDELIGDRAVLTVLDPAWSTLRVVPVELGVDDATVRIELSGDALDLRIVDRGKRPIEGADVTVYQRSRVRGWFAETSSDADGLCRFRGVDLPGLYVNASHPDHGALAGFDLPTPEERGDVIEIVLDGSSRLRIRALDGEVPQSNLAVEFFEGGGEHGIGQATTDVEGKAGMDAIAAGEYVVRVASPGYWPSEQRVEAKRDGPCVPIQVRALGSVEIEVVSSSTGLHVSGARVEIESREFGARVAQWAADGLVTASSAALATDDRGMLRIEGLPHGSYAWLVEGGDTPYGGTFDVAPRTLTRVELRVP